MSVTRRSVLEDGNRLQRDQILIRRGTDGRSAILTPEIEVGGRIGLKGGSVLRTFALAGVSLRSNDEWNGRASFIGGQRSPSFGMQAPLDRAALRLGAGAQLFANKQVDLQIRYDAELGSEAKSHNIAAKFAYRF